MVLGTAREHYRCYTCYKPQTKAEVQADTVQFFPHQYNLLHITPTKDATVTATDLVKATTNPAPQLQWDKLGNEILQAVRQLGDIFQQIVSKQKRQTTQKTIPIMKNAKMPDILKMEQTNNLYANTKSMAVPETGVQAAYKPKLAPELTEWPASKNRPHIISDDKEELTGVPELRVQL